MPDNPLTKKRSKMPSKREVPLPFLGCDPMMTTVAEYFKCQNNTKGLNFGIELEIESSNDIFPDGDRLEYWTRTTDGSLRAANKLDQGGAEFVCSKPLPHSKVTEALEEFDMAISRARTSIRKSTRCSTHVHVNVQDLTLSQLGCFLTLYYLLEPALSAYNGEHRANNQFCIQLRHSPAILRGLISCLTQDGKFEGIDNYKYSALNWTHILRGRYGTIEFRQGDGISSSAMEIVPWLDIITELYSVSQESFSTPVDIILAMSGRNWKEFMQAYTPTTYHYMLPTIEAVPYTEAGQVDLMMLESMRFAQSLAYEMDWETSTKDSSKKTKGSSGALDMEALRQAVQQQEVHDGIRAGDIFAAAVPRPARWDQLLAQAAPPAVRVEYDDFEVDTTDENQED